MSHPALFENNQTRLKQCRHGAMLYFANDVYIGRSLDRYGEWSYGESHLFQQLVQPGQWVLDLGANIGTHTILFAKQVGPTGRVLAFEPQRVVFQMLCANIALNNVRNVHALHQAVGRQPGTATIPSLDYEQENNFGGLSLDGHQEGETVPVVTVDQLELPACHFMKLDVEGMEGDVLAGASRTIEKYHPAIYFENDRQESSAALIQQLFDFQYRLYWHVTPLYSPQNFFGDPENVFPGVVSVCVLGLSRSTAQDIKGMREIQSPDDSWNS